MKCVAYVVFEGTLAGF